MAVASLAAAAGPADLTAARSAPASGNGPIRRESGRGSKPWKAYGERHPDDDFTIADQKAIDRAAEKKERRRKRNLAQKRAGGAR